MLRNMRNGMLRVLCAALLLLLGISFLGIPFLTHFTPRAYAQGPCTTRSDNLTRNGSVTDGGYDTAHGVVANSWNAFLINGEWPAFDLADNESANGDIGGSSSQYVHGDGTRFDSGIYQIVSGTQPGASYEFSVGWAAMLRDTGGGNNTKVDDQVIRRVGYDPIGGTDPQSQNVHWGPEVGTGSSGRSLNHPDMRITFKAESNQVSVFVRVYNLSTSPSDKAFFDVMCLLPRGDIPVQTVPPSATATPANTDVPPTPAETRTPRPTVPPSATPTETPVPATLRPAEVLTLTPISVAEARETNTPTARRVIPSAGSGNTTAAAANTTNASDSGGSGNALSFTVIAGSIGIIGISLLGILLVGGFAVYRIFIRQVDDALDPTYYPDDQTHYQ